MTEAIKSPVVGKDRCPDCADENADVNCNNLILYEDGSKTCFRHNKTWMPNGDVIQDGKQVEKGVDNHEYQSEVNESNKKIQTEYPLITDGEYSSLNRRGLSQEICRRFDVQVGTYCNEHVVIFNRHVHNVRVRQKIRTADKRFWAAGPKNVEDEIQMFGANWFDESERKHLVVHTGEFDAMASQMAVDDFHAYHCTSLDNGDGDVSRWIKKHYQTLMKYKSIILCFDTDDSGIKARNKFINEFNYGVVRTAKIHLKDANEMWVNGEGDKLKWAIFNAETYKPSQVVTVKDIKERAMKRPEKGPDWPWKSMTEITYGMRPGCYLMFGPEGTGKTEMVREILTNNLEMNPPMASAVFSFEQEVESTLQRLAGARIGKRLHLPGVEWDEKLVSEQMDYFDNKIFLYDYKSHLKFDDIVKSIYYLANCKGIKFFVLDNLTAMLSHPYLDGKKVTNNEYLGHVANALKQMSRELGLLFFTIGHNNNDNMSKQVYVTTSPKDEDAYLSRDHEEMQQYINRPGMTWESGRMPTMENISENGTIKKVFDYVFAIARNKVSEDDWVHRTIEVKALKTRLASENEGKIFKIIYDYKTGSLTEVSTTVANPVQLKGKEVF